MLDVLINYLFMYVPQRNKWINFYFELFEIHNTYFPAHSRICLLFRFFFISSWKSNRVKNIARDSYGQYAQKHGISVYCCEKRLD